MASEALQHLNKEIGDLIDTFRKESEKHKSLHRAFRYVVFAFTGCATVMSSIALKFPDSAGWLNIGVVLATVAVGVVTSIEGLRKPSELWIQERNVFHALQDLKRELNFKAIKAPDDLNLGDFFSRMQSILAASTEKWTNSLLDKHAGDKNPSRDT